MNGISQGNFNLRDMQRSSEGNDGELVARGSSFGSSGSASGSADSTQEGANENEPKNQVFNLDGLGAVKMEQTENSYVLHYFGDLGNFKLFITLHPACILISCSL